MKCIDIQYWPNILTSNNILEAILEDVSHRPHENLLCNLDFKNNYNFEISIWRISETMHIFKSR